MNKFNLITATCLAAGLMSASFASAATVTVTDVVGIWSSATKDDGTSAAGVGTSAITWGTPAGSGYSGYVFEGATVPFSPAPETQFAFGKFTHRNFPVYPPALASAVLDLSITVLVDGESHTLGASYQFTHDETPNTAGTCPVGSVSVCDDIVSFAPIANSFDTVEVDGIKYTFLLDNFVNSMGVPVDRFLTQENAANVAELVGRFTSEIPAVPAVPVPAALPLLMAGLGAFGVVRSRRKAA